MQPLLGTTKDDEKKKPDIYKLYDFTKGGTDVMDQRIATFSCKTKSNRWTIAVFAYFLDICLVNAATVLAMNRGFDPRKVNSYNFGMDLVLRLIPPHVQQLSLTGLQPQYVIKYKIDLLLNDGVFSSRQQDASFSNNTQYPQKSKNRKRCLACVLEISGPGQKKTKTHDKNKKPVSNLWQACLLPIFYTNVC